MLNYWEPERKKVRRITESESESDVFDEENEEDLAFFDDWPESELTMYSDERCQSWSESERGKKK